MRISRRQFLRHSAVAGAAFLVSGAFDLALARIAHGARTQAPGFGPLANDPAGALDLPAGFQYRALSTSIIGRTDDARFNQRLSNGDPVPARHDGMAAFAGDDGITVLVRNHELDPGDVPGVRVDPQHPYDPLGTGGTTTLWIDADRKVVRSFASLSGTFRNCAGGPTPWGSWLSAEECTYMPGPVDRVSQDRRPDVSRPHGYVFEVDAHATGLVAPVPIRAMGRFYHEALAVDPETGDVYLTEDRGDGLLYRYTPDVIARGERKPSEMRAGHLAMGGRLEAMRVPLMPSLRTQNWGPPGPAIVPGQRFDFDWVGIPEVEPDIDEEVTRTLARARVGSADPRGHRDVRTAPGSTRAQGFALGCTQFARAEGITYHSGSLYVCCTSGGAGQCGQVWRVNLRTRQLSLVIEASNRDVLDGPDNLCPTPWGDLVICEDGVDTDRVLGLTPEGAVYEIARNAYNKEEFAGACFSPDGRTLFVNRQEPGVTYAIWGPWGTRARPARRRAPARNPVASPSSG